MICYDICKQKYGGHHSWFHFVDSNSHSRDVVTQNYRGKDAYIALSLVYCTNCAMFMRFENPDKVVFCPCCRIKVRHKSPQGNYSVKISPKKRIEKLKAGIRYFDERKKGSEMKIEQIMRENFLADA